jgi:hypothetical protein
MNKELEVHKTLNLHSWENADHYFHSVIDRRICPICEKIQESYHQSEWEDEGSSSASWLILWSFRKKRRFNSIKDFIKYLISRITLNPVMPFNKQYDRKRMGNIGYD